MQKSYLPASLGGETTSADLSPHTKPVSSDVSSSVQSAISSTAEMVKEYVDTAKGTVQGLLGTSGTQDAQLAEQKSSLDSAYTTLETTDD